MQKIYYINVYKEILVTTSNSHHGMFVLLCFLVHFAAGRVDECHPVSDNIGLGKIEPHIHLILARDTSKTQSNSYKMSVEVEVEALFSKSESRFAMIKIKPINRICWCWN